MAATVVRVDGEEGSVRNLGAGYAEAAFDLTFTGGTVTLASIQSPFTEVSSVQIIPDAAVASVPYGKKNATDKSKFDVFGPALMTARVLVRGRGM